MCEADPDCNCDDDHEDDCVFCEEKDRRIAELEQFARDTRDELICSTDDTCECFGGRECILCAAKRLVGEK